MNEEKRKLLNAMSGKPIDAGDSSTNLPTMVGVICSIMLAISMMMPFASGPIGITISGWKVMGSVGGVFMAAFILVSLFSAISKKPILVSLCGIGLLLNMMMAMRKIDELTSQIQSQMSGDSISEAMGAVMAGQVGLSWGGGLSFLLAILLVANPFLRFKPR